MNEIKYNVGNYEKYMSKNPLKRKMVSKLNEKIVAEVRSFCEQGCVTILDAGCGEGFITRIIVDNIDGITITGLEYTEEAIEIAREQCPGVQFIKGDIHHMPFEDGSFDLVLCTEVLEHLEDPGAALSEIIRVARKGVLITVPHEPWFCIGNLIALKNVSRLGNPIDHINHWTYAGFKHFLKKETKGAASLKFEDEWHMSRSFPWSIAKKYKSITP